MSAAFVPGLQASIIVARMNRHRFSLLWGLVLSAGCSGDDGSAPDPYVTREGFCGEWAKAACTSRVVSACAATDQDACVATQAQFCTGVVSAEAYRKELARSCVSRVRSAYADERLTPEEARIVLTGGAPCDFACIDVDGECLEPTIVGGGMECTDPTSVCDEGFYCDGTNCLALRTEGRECSASMPCAPELKCVGEEGAQVCEAKAATGEPCATGDDCVSGICSLPAGAAEGICGAEIILSTAEPACMNLR